jgi:hypothetical protein
MNNLTTRRHPQRGRMSTDVKISVSSTRGRGGRNVTMTGLYEVSDDAVRVTTLQITAFMVL